MEAAEENLKAAIRLYFQGAHIGPVLTLANSAREVVAVLGERGKLEILHACRAIGTIDGKQFVPALEGAV